jgi:hypothetical protein
MQIGFAGLLALLLIVLKLTHVIAWSWLWVLSPLWIGFLLCLAFFVAALIVAALLGDA